MLPDHKAGFELNQRLEADSVQVMWLGLCELRIQDDARWPWLILVPQRPGIEEVHEMTPLDQAMLSFESNMVSKALKEATDCSKINVGALGNIVRQLHVHIVARNEDDAGWPGPVWGHGMRVPYAREKLHQFCEKIRSRL